MYFIDTMIQSINVILATNNLKTKIHFDKVKKSHKVPHLYYFQICRTTKVSLDLDAFKSVSSLQLRISQCAGSMRLMSR